MAATSRNISSRSPGKSGCRNSFCHLSATESDTGQARHCRISLQPDVTSFVSAAVEFLLRVAAAALNPTLRQHDSPLQGGDLGVGQSAIGSHSYTSIHYMYKSSLS